MDNSLALFVMWSGLFAIISIVAVFAVYWKKNSLPAKFDSLKPLNGKSKTHILSVAGQPNAVTAMEGGKTMLQWIKGGYHIRLIFNGETCEGVNHEFKHG